MSKNKMHILEDENISLKAKGLYMLIKFNYLLDVEFTKNNLMLMCSDSIDSFESASLELEKAGYLIKQKNDKKHDFKYTYIIN